MSEQHFAEKLTDLRKKLLAWGWEEGSLDTLLLEGLECTCGTLNTACQLCDNV